MTGDGAPILAARGDGLRVAIIASRWHDLIMSALQAGARRAVQDSGAELVADLRVAGAFELAVLAKRVAAECDAVVALAVVIRGGTPHFDYVCQAATHGLMQASLDTGTPIGFGVLTCDTEAQAWERAGVEGSSEDKGYEAAMASIDAARQLRDLVPTPS